MTRDEYTYIIRDQGRGRIHLGIEMYGSVGWHSICRQLWTGTRLVIDGRPPDADICKACRRVERQREERAR